MMKYERFTERVDSGFVSELDCRIAYNKLCAIEDKIEQGEIIYPKYPIYSNVYIIDYLDEKGFSVYNGKPVVRECFVTSITQMTRTATSVIYRVQPHELPIEVLDGDVDSEFWERGLYERDLFSTPEEAYKRLKELQG
jgi:hypothetical protein